MMRYQPVVATLGYVVSPDRKRVLLIHRNARRDDVHYGKYNGLGGKLDRNEDIVTGMRREIREEASIECETLQLAGTISWPGFGKQGEDWFGFIFLITQFRGDVRAKNSEGELVWADKNELLSLPMWEGDRYFIPLVFADPLRQFHGVMPYDGGKPVDWRYTLMDG